MAFFQEAVGECGIIRIVKPLRVLSIFGTRPEAVKMAPVIQALSGSPGVESLVCVTAQHREMLDQVLALFNLHPDVDLDLMRPDQNLAQLTADIISALDPVLENLQPDWVLVQGDTTTVLAAALLAYYRHIRVGHVEAGLRTWDKWQPFPEEINRQAAGLIADLHFAPTELSRQNLLHQGVPDWRVKVTGNPVIDALQGIARQPCPRETRQMLDAWGVAKTGKRLVLVTAHRRENFGKPIEDICSALQRLAQSCRGEIVLVYPVHLNPNIQEPVFRLLEGFENIVLLPPQEYLPMVHLLGNATLVLTDSGGIQEEATALRVPTLVMRNVTERPEGVEAGVLKLVGSDPERIFTEAMHLLEDPAAHAAMAHAPNPFGDGHAAQRIVKSLLEYREP